VTSQLPDLNPCHSPAARLKKKCFTKNSHPLQKLHENIRHEISAIPVQQLGDVRLETHSQIVHSVFFSEVWNTQIELYYFSFMCSLYGLSAKKV
jgi:hypothetical protein